MDLDRLYAAVDVDESLNDLPAVIADLCGTRSAQVRCYDPAADRPLDLMNYFPADACHRYFAEFADNDPWLPLLDLVGAGIIKGDALIPPSEIERSAMYNELLRPIGDDTARMLGWASLFHGRRLIVATHRAGADAPFTSVDAERLQLVCHHLERVLTLRSRMAETRSDGRNASVLLDATGKAVLLVDRDLCVEACSQAARVHLDRRDGLCLRGGRLCFSTSDLDHAVRESVRATIDRAQARQTSFRVRRAEPAQPLFLCVLPASTASTKAVICLDDPAHRPGDSAGRTLGEIYDLSSAEVSVAMMLAQGERIAVIAEQRGVTRETVRSQTKHIYSKMDLSRQAELVRLVGGLPSRGE